MPNTSHLNMEIAMPSRYAVPSPRRSDAISGALRCAFEPPLDDRDIMMLLRRIDHAEYTKRGA